MAPRGARVLDAQRSLSPRTPPPSPTPATASSTTSSRLTSTMPPCTDPHVARLRLTGSAQQLLAATSTCAHVHMYTAAAAAAAAAAAIVAAAKHTMRLHSGSSFLEPPPLLLGLPGPLLQAVLRRLDARGVLSVARTCSQLRDAAPAALDSIEQYTNTSTRLDSLLLYLERQGQHVSSLDVRLPPSLHLPRLPASCGRLQALSFDGGRVQLGASGGQPGVLHATSALTSLSIDSIDSPDSAQGAAAAVARLPRLQRLELATSFSGGGVLPGSMLAPLQSLTALRLTPQGGQSWLQAATLEHLSSLSSLRELELSGCFSAKPDLSAAATALQHLHQLTALALKCIDNVSLAGLSSSLQRLKLAHCAGVDPQVLVVHTQLKHLRLSDCSLAGGPTGAAALLEHLQRCTRLTHLRFEMHLCDEPAAALSALTASSSLEVLQLFGSELPPAAWHAMFGGSKRLPRLQQLVLAASGTDAGDDAAGLQPDDLPALVRCCPALQDLGLLSLQGCNVPDLLLLTALTGLTCLCAFRERHPDMYFPIVCLSTSAPQPLDVASQLQQRIDEQKARGRWGGFGWF